MIPEEAVEAALAANRAYKSQRGIDNAEKQMRAVLEAAAPYLKAEAWDEGYDYCNGDGVSEWVGNPYRSQQ